MCMIDDCDDRAVVLNDKMRTARKPHRCTECGRPIAAGEQYRNETTVFAGSLDEDKTCTHCGVLREWLVAECGGFVYTGVLEDFSDHASEYQRFDLWRLKAASDRRWKRKDGTLMPVPTIPMTTEAIHESTQPAVS